ncbi:MAG: hypothetical protein EDX89_02685 [Acidobacteria bacterium]|nr:MAG: hypothetical protein EDX89_02685 [Acidobacteriota bacterium]MCE7957280.1 hypothetical protein [Acidobacteria bacterium ACB2]
MAHGSIVPWVTQSQSTQTGIDSGGLGSHGMSTPRAPKAGITSGRAGAAASKDTPATRNESERRRA